MKPKKQITLNDSKMIRVVPNRLSIQTGIKIQPVKASQRISAVFLELLEQQFPIKAVEPIRLRYASQFADNLNIHVNHLNRIMKEAMNKTTTQVISERILREAKFLLHNSNLSVANIAYVLGFTEATHFNSFFKKHTHFNPLTFRKSHP